MSSFTGFNAPVSVVYDQSVSQKSGKDSWRTTEEFSYWLQSDYSLTVRVPAGFQTDGASVPRLFWSLLPPWGAYGQAAILHDYMCEHNVAFYDDGRVKLLSMGDVDREFLHAMKALEVPTWKRYVMYAAVRLWRAFGSPKMQ